MSVWASPKRRHPGGALDRATAAGFLCGRLRRFGPLVLEVEAATFEIAALVHSLYGRQIGHPLLRIRIKKPDEL